MVNRNEVQGQKQAKEKRESNQWIGESTPSNTKISDQTEYRKLGRTKRCLEEIQRQSLTQKNIMRNASYVYFLGRIKFTHERGRASARIRMNDKTLNLRHERSRRKPWGECWRRSAHGRRQSCREGGQCDPR